MVERSVKVRLMAEIGQYEANMRKAADAAKTTGKETAKAGEVADQGARKMAGSADKAAAANDKVADTAERVGKNMRGAGVDAGKMADGLDDTRQSTEHAAKSADEAVGTWGRMANTARDNEQAWSTASTAMLGIGAAAVAGTGLAVKTFADFDKAMSSVQAATLASEEDMNKLREAAVKAGADTAFSAEEAAAGIEELAKAGVATEDVLGGGLDGALSLAAAGALEVGDAAEIAASALTQFKLEGSDVEHIADLLAAGAGKAQGSVEDLGAALNQSGLVAASTGLTIEETTGALASFASAGLTGSDAGTSFKTMLMALNPSSKEAGELMDSLGLSAYDAQGNFVGMSEYAGILQNALKGMSDEQRNATLKTIFGSDAVRAANILYEQGAPGIQKWEDAVNDAGYAAETAAAMQDNLAGDLEKLGGAIDTAFLKSGSGANDFLRGLTQGAEDVVDAIGRIPAPVLTATTAIAGIGGGGLLVVGGLMKAIGAIADTRQAMKDLGVTADKVKPKLAAVGKAAGFAAGIATLGIAMGKIAESGYMDDIDDGMGRVALALNRVARESPKAEAAMDSLFQDRDGGDLIDGVEDFESAIDRTFNKSWDESFNDWAEGIIGSVTGIKGSSHILEESWGRVDEQLASMVSSGNTDQAAAAFENLAVMARRQGIGYDELSTKLPGYKDALAGASAETEGAAGGAEAVAEGLAGVAQEGEDAALSLDDVYDGLYALGMIEMDARTAVTNFHASVGDFNDALKEINEAAKDPEIADMGPILKETGDDFDLASEAGGKMNDVFQEIIRKGTDMAKTAAAAGDSFGTIRGNLDTTYGTLMDSARALGLNEEHADALVRQLLDVPEDVDINTWMSRDALEMAMSTGGVLEGLPNEALIRTWMGDDAFLEAVRTKAAALGIPEHEAISSFMSDAARGEAGDTTAAVLGIPKGASVTSFMEDKARQEAWLTKESIDAIPKNVEIRVTTIQHQRNIETWEQTKLADMGVIKPRAGEGSVLLPSKATGGRVPALANGGRLPSTGLGTDKILGVSSAGVPTAWVDDREWVVNQRMSDKYDGLIGMVNRDDPRVRHLAGFASGGRPASREFSAAPAGFSGRVSASVDVAGIEAAVERGTARAVSQWRPAWQISDRQFDGVMQHYTRAKTRR